MTFTNGTENSTNDNSNLNGPYNHGSDLLNPRPLTAGASSSLNHLHNNIINQLLAGKLTSSPESNFSTEELASDTYRQYQTRGTTSSSYFIQDQNEWFVEGSHLWPVLLTGYSFVFLVGVIGNVLLLFALYGSGGTRRARALPVRNHLMVNLAAADLFVTAVCVPISACAAASHACWPNFVVSWMCQLSPLLQRTPVAASTLSLALLSLDRWAAFRHPRFAQRFRERRFVVMSMASIWILASLVSAPAFWARQWETFQSFVPIPTSSSAVPGESLPLGYPEDEGQGSQSGGGPWSPYNSENDHDHYDSGSTGTTSSFSTHSDHVFNYSTSSSNHTTSDHWSGICLEKWTNLGLEIAYIATYLGTAFISPALIVAACHASVSQKLTSQLKPGPGPQSNSSNAAKTKTTSNTNDIFPGGLFGGGVRQKPKQVIIVAHDPNNRLIGNDEPDNKSQALCGQKSQKIIPCDPNSDDDDDEYLQMQIQADLESFRQISEHIKLNSSTASKKVGTGKRKMSTSSIIFKTLHPNSHFHRSNNVNSQSHSSIQLGIENQGASPNPSQHEEYGGGGGAIIVEPEIPTTTTTTTKSRHLAFIDTTDIDQPSHISSSAAGATSNISRRQSINQFIFSHSSDKKNSSSNNMDMTIAANPDNNDFLTPVIRRNSLGGTSLNNNNIFTSFNVKPIKASKNETSIIRSHRRFRKKLLSNEKRQQMMLMTTLSPPPPTNASFLPTYSSQSFRSRRRAANLMAALAVVFLCCWLPYVICTIWEICTSDKKVVRYLLPFALFLGHAHSAINPVVSWRLNRSAFVRFQQKSFFASLVPSWSWLRVCRLSCRSMASCRYYCCSCTGNWCCCVRNYEMNSSSFGESHSQNAIRAFGVTPRLATPAGNIHYNKPGGFQGRYNIAGARGGGRPSLAAAINSRHKRQMSTCAKLRYHLCCQWCKKKRRHSTAQHYPYAGGPGGYVQRRRPQHHHNHHHYKRRRRGSSPDDYDDDPWNANSSTNEAALGAFHPKYLSRMPAPDPISRCHTSHFLK